MGRSFLRVVPRAAGGGDKENLPRGWTGYDDPKSGDRYYFNEETGKTQWEKPGEASDAAESRGRSEEELAKVKKFLLETEGLKQLCSSIPEGALDELCQYVKIEDYAPEELICREADPGEAPHSR